MIEKSDLNRVLGQEDSVKPVHYQDDSDYIYMATNNTENGFQQG